MKPGMMRWKVIPFLLHSRAASRAVSVRRRVGSVLGAPASAMKLATVPGASLLRSRQVMRPMLVSKTAVGPVGSRAGLTVSGESGSAPAEGGALAAGDVVVCVGGVV